MLGQINNNGVSCSEKSSIITYLKFTQISSCQMQYPNLLAYLHSIDGWPLLNSFSISIFGKSGFSYRFHGQGMKESGARLYKY